MIDSRPWRGLCCSHVVSLDCMVARVVCEIDVVSDRFDRRVCVGDVRFL